MSAMFPYLRLAVAACAIFHSSAVPAAAEDASRWDGDARSAIRLIAGSRSGDIVRAGVEIRLKPGWHTYWRYPGDAGVPPRFDFQGSQNIKSVDVRWPAPKRLPEAGMTAIGYDRDVILPLVIVPQDPAKPVVLRLKLDYAVCEKLCVPADGKAELALADGRRPSEPWSRPKRACRRRSSSARERASPSAPSSGTAARTSRVSSWTLRHRTVSRSTCLPKARRRSGRCRCRTKPAGRHRACDVHLRARRRAARCAIPGSPRDPDGGRRKTRRSRSRSASTNSPGTLICARRACAIRH